MKRSTKVAESNKYGEVRALTVKYRKKTVYCFFKRFFDIVVSSLAIILLSPLFLIVAILIKRDGGPVFYCQTRVGKMGKEFKMIKFRSMCVNADSPEMLEKLRCLNEMDGPVFKMQDDPRITKIGKFLRKYSIDEIPQLINVLKNDMTIVGPRPALPCEAERYNDRHRQRLLVKQGLTCYWQTQPHRNDIPFEEWINLDLKYIDRRGALEDLKIMFKTFRVVFSGDSI